MFACGDLLFANFSTNILNGGLIGASFFKCQYCSPCIDPQCAGVYNASFVLLEVQPASTTVGWSYSVSGEIPEIPLRLVELPRLNHVTSGSPTVTEHFGPGLQLTASPTLGYVFLKTPVTVFVQVDPSDITGGTISALDTIFVTPEPAPTFLLGSGLLVIFLYQWQKPQKNPCNTATRSLTA
jgi:hypothetical protein